MELKNVVKLASLDIIPYRVFSQDDSLVYIDLFQDGDWHGDSYDPFDSTEKEMLELTLLKLEYSTKHLEVDYYEPYMKPYKL